MLFKKNLTPSSLLLLFLLLLFLVVQNPSSLSPGMLCTPKRSAPADVSHDLFATPRSAIAKRLPFQLLHNSSLVQNRPLTRKNTHTLLYMLE